MTTLVTSLVLCCHLHLATCLKQHGRSVQMRA
jgi:hypothetical protein